MPLYACSIIITVYYHNVMGVVCVCVCMQYDMTSTTIKITVMVPTYVSLFYDCGKPVIIV